MVMDSPTKTKVPDTADMTAGLDWSLPENEIRFFMSLAKNRPVGLERFFQMFFVTRKFSDIVGREIPSEVLWAQLNTLYDMEALNENDDPPKWVVKEIDFELPAAEFGPLMDKKLGKDDNSSNSNESGETAGSDKASEEAAPPSSAAKKPKQETPGTATKSRKNIIRRDKDDEESSSSKTDLKETPKNPRKRPATKGSESGSAAGSSVKKPKGSVSSAAGDDTPASKNKRLRTTTSSGRPKKGED